MKKNKVFCPVFLTLSLIANKWSIGIIESLLNEKNHMMRFGQLQKSLHAITQAELIKQLKEFEKSGIIERKVYAEIPPRVEYKLTELGLSLLEPIESLSNWAKKYGEIVQNNLKNSEK